MMQESLLISNLIRHADRHHPDGEIVSRRAEGDGIHRYTYRYIISHTFVSGIIYATEAGVCVCVLNQTLL
jgi:hypothetical protein